VVCNEKVKFGSLLQKAEQLGAEFVATGHYARIAKRGRYELRKGLDGRKDQSYFLFSLRQDQLARSLMPLGDLGKEATRAIAKKMGLKTAEKVESQEICFVPDKDYGRFLKEGAKVPDQRGEIVTRDGKVLGHHDGIQYFTIGQREGLNLGGQPRPLYVVALDAERNRVVAGLAEDLMRDDFSVANVTWSAIEEPSEPVTCSVKIRYNHPGCPATIETAGDGRWRVRLPEAQRAITPGQAAVFYREDLVLGGGWIV
jgi:tRNA-specific 2-thiouridylase